MSKDIQGQAGIYFIEPLGQDSRGPTDPISAFPVGSSAMRVSAPVEGEQEWGQFCPTCHGVVRIYRDALGGSQEFFAHNYGILFARAWDAEGGDWGDWQSTQLH